MTRLVPVHSIRRRGGLGGGAGWLTVSSPTQRGGEGNIHKDKHGGHSSGQEHHESLLDKAKQLFHHKDGKDGK